MKDFLKKQLTSVLRILAQLTIRKFKPGIIGVTGSVGKTSTKFAIACALRSHRNIRFSQDSHNNEIGFPLAILGEWREKDLKLVSTSSPAGGRIFRKTVFWTKVLIGAISKLLFLPRSRYPEVLVLEYGADKPGDIKKLMEIARPHISVITAIGDAPVHVEYYSGPEQVAKEKGRLVEGLFSNSFAVLNFDDPIVMKLQERTRAHILTFGFGVGAEVRITNFENRIEKGKPVGVSFKLEYGGSFVPIRIDGAYGKAVAYSAAAATSVAIVFGMHLVHIAESLLYFDPPPHRMKLFTGFKGALIVDDTYNASPLSTLLAIETVFDIPSARKVAILGDMLELGSLAREEHMKIGRVVAKKFKLLITVGPQAQYIADSAQKAGLRGNYIHSFATAEEAREKLSKLIKKGDLVLIKGSRAVHLEKLVNELQTT